MRFQTSFVPKIIPIKASIFLSLLGASFLAVESYLNLLGTSLCKTAACEIVGSYLNIKEQLLVAGGSVFFWLLTLALFFSLRYPQRFGRVILLFMTPAVIFDGALIGYQIFSIKQYCTICICTAVLFLLVIMLCCWAYNETFLLVCVLLAWIGAFGANSIMARNVVSGDTNSMILIGKNAYAATLENPPPTITIIFSMDCPHCLELISYIGESRHDMLNWRFASVDQDDVALGKIAAFVQRAPTDDNLFFLLRDIKSASPKENINKKSVDSILEKNKAAFSYLAHRNINKIPVLIIQKSENEQTILTGSDTAKNYLQDFFIKYANTTKY